MKKCMNRLIINLINYIFKKILGRFRRHKQKPISFLRFQRNHEVGMRFAK